MYRSSKTLYLTADKSEVVEAGDARAAWLLVRAGGELPMPEARRYGLVDASVKAVEGAPENKAVLMPAEVKRTRAKK